MTTLRTLDDDDIKVLRDMVRKFVNETVNAPSRPGGDRAFSEAQDWLAPEVYVAKPQGQGIPGITRGSPDRPGVAKCDVYQIKQATETLVPIGLNRWVYNLSDQMIVQDWIIVVRDKFGRWLCASEPKRMIAVLCHKVGLPIIPMTSDDVFPYPSTPPFAHYYGSYSWHEQVQGVDGKWDRKTGGYEGTAGGKNAVVDLRRTNANIHLARPRVQIWAGIQDEEFQSSSWDAQSSLECFSSEEQSSDEPPASNVSIKWLFDSGLYREDGPTVLRYIISHVAGNEPVQP